MNCNWPHTSNTARWCSGVGTGRRRCNNRRIRLDIRFDMGSEWHNQSLSRHNHKCTSHCSRRTRDRRLGRPGRNRYRHWSILHHYWNFIFSKSLLSTHGQLSKDSPSATPSSSSCRMKTLIFCGFSASSRRHYKDKVQMGKFSSLTFEHIWRHIKAAYYSVCEKIVICLRKWPSAEFNLSQRFHTSKS